MKLPQQHPDQEPLLAGTSENEAAQEAGPVSQRSVGTDSELEGLDDLEETTVIPASPTGSVDDQPEVEYGFVEKRTDSVNLERTDSGNWQAEL